MWFPPKLYHCIYYCSKFSFCKQGVYPENTPSLFFTFPRSKLLGSQPFMHDQPGLGISYRPTKNHVGEQFILCDIIGIAKNRLNNQSLGGLCCHLWFRRYSLLLSSSLLPLSYECFQRTPCPPPYYPIGVVDKFSERGFLKIWGVGSLWFVHVVIKLLMYMGLRVPLETVSNMGFSCQ